MDEQKRKEIESRIRSLESELAEIKQLLQTNSSDLSPNIQTTKSQPPPPPPPSTIQPKQTQDSQPQQISRVQTKPIPRQKTFEFPEHMKSGEYWLNKIGIGLVIFAVLFFFKYSIDQGWLVPKLRIGMGIVFGCILQFLAFKTYLKKRHFSLVLFGGGIAVFYISGFAAFQMFSLVSHQTAFFFMLAVTLYAISLSIKQNEQILSLIGVLGAMATPFLLYTGEGDIPGLMMYMSVVIAGTSVIYFFKSWRGLLWTTYIIGVFIVLLGGLDIVENQNAHTDSERWSVQLALVLCWLAFAIIPLLREVFAQINPQKYKYIQFTYLKKLVSEQFEQSAAKHAYILFVTTPVIVYTASTLLWTENYMPQKTWGWIAMATAMFYWFTAYQLKKWANLKTVQLIKLLVGILFLTVSFFLLFEGKTLMAVLGTEAFVLFYIGNKFNDSKFLRSSYILYAILFFGTAIRIGWDFNRPDRFFNLENMTDLWVIGLMFAAFYVSKINLVKRIFFPAGILLLTALFDQQFNGNLLFFLLTAVMLGMHLTQRYLHDKVLTTYAQVYLGALSLLMINRLMLLEISLFPTDLGVRPIFNLTTGIDVLFLAALLYAARLIRSQSEKTIYYIWAHIIILSIFLREFQSSENGQGIVTIAWGLYAAILLIAGLRLNKVSLRKAALITLMVVVAKLFLVDLSNLETIWRILLFLGFGGVFLLLSYYFKSLWKDSDDTGSSPNQTDIQS
ncbi:MAG: DUF2339 domain-containing protein [Calditrichaeota bacterium]|nr:MAG: DUF2339 domain-containing protein [Calditrichota bacterium]